MCNEILLRRPTNELVIMFDNFWGNGVGKDQEFYLFENENGQPVEEHKILIRKDGLVKICNKVVIDFEAIKQGEELLNEVFAKIGLWKNYSNDQAGLYEAILLLDRIYSTHLEDPYRYSVRLKKYINDLSQDVSVENIARIDLESDDNRGKGIYSYSFATKICNRIEPNKFPIYDSYVAGLLIWFRDNGDEYNNIPNKDAFKEFVLSNKKDKNRHFYDYELANYETYKNKYNMFKNMFNLDLTYQQLDRFLWTYAKMVFRYKQLYPQPLDNTYEPKYLDYKYIASQVSANIS